MTRTVPRVGAPCSGDDHRKETPNAMSARRPLALAATGLTLALLVAGCGSGGHSSMPSSASTAAVTGAGRTADISFAQLMIPHHEQAIEMADLALSQASSAGVRELAEEGYRVRTIGRSGADAPCQRSISAWAIAWPSRCKAN